MHYLKVKFSTEWEILRTKLRLPVAVARRRTHAAMRRRSWLEEDSFASLSDSEDDADMAAEAERLTILAHDSGAARTLQAMWRRKLGRRKLLAMCRATVQRCVDPYSGEVYYYNVATQESAWDPPPLLDEALVEGEMQAKRDAERDAEPEWQAALTLQRAYRTRAARKRLFKKLAASVLHKYDAESGSWYYQIGSFTTWEKPRLLRYAERAGGGARGAAPSSKESSDGDGAPPPPKRMGGVLSTLDKRAEAMEAALEQGFADVAHPAARDAAQLMWGPIRGAAIVDAGAHLVRFSVREATEGTGQRAVVVRPGLDFGDSLRTPLAGVDPRTIAPRLRRDAPSFDATTDFTEVAAFATFSRAFEGGGTTPLRVEECDDFRMGRIMSEYGHTPSIPRSEALKTFYHNGVTMHAWPDGSFRSMFPGIEQWHVVETTRPQRFRVVAGSAASTRARGVGGADARFGDVGWKPLFAFFAYPLVRVRCFEKPGAGSLRALMQVDAGAWGAQPVEVAREDGTSLDPSETPRSQRRREHELAEFDPETLALEGFYASSTVTFYAFANAGVPGTVHMRISHERNLGCHRSVVEFDGDTGGAKNTAAATVQRGGAELPHSHKHRQAAKDQFRSTNRRRGKSIYVLTVPAAGTTRLFLHAVGGDGAKGQIPTRCRFSTKRPVKPWRLRGVFYAFLADPDEEPCFEPNAGYNM